MKKSSPYHCPECIKDPATWYGKLVFEDEEIPNCPNHRIVNPGGAVTEKVIKLVPA